MDWQAIERAPKDGMPILGWDGKDMAVIQWYRGGEHPSCQWWDVIPEHDGGKWYPTHWQSLPSPPSDKP